MATMNIRMALDTQGVPIGGHGLWTANGTSDFGGAVRTSGDGENVELATVVGGSSVVFFLDSSDLTALGAVAGSISGITASLVHKISGGANSPSVTIEVDYERPDNQNQVTFGSPLSALTSTSYITQTTTSVANDPTGSVAWTVANLRNATFIIDINNWTGTPGPSYFVDQFYITVTYTPKTWWSLTLPFATLYQFALSLPTAYTLPFDYFSNGTFYPSGTTFTWVAASAPTDKGYWMAAGDAFAGAAYVVDATDRPKAPRGFVEVTAFANGSTSFYGGFPGVAAGFNNHLVYTPGGYTVGTTSPTLCIYDGQFDRPIATVPNTSSGTVPKAVMTTLTANGVVYVATLDTGSDSTSWVGRVFSLDIESGQMTPVGLPIATGHVPYALCWHAGMLWCGTHRQSSAASGKIFRIRPGIDTDWTADYDLSTSTVASCASLASYGGKLYVGTTNAAAAFAKVLVRDTAGAYTTSTTASGGTATANNGFPSMTVFNGNLYAGYYNANTPAVSKIYKYDGTSWTTAYTGSGTTIVPYVALFSDLTNMFALGGGVGVSAVLLKTADGSTWTDQSVFLSQGSPASTGLPAFGVVVH